MPKKSGGSKYCSRVLLNLVRWNWLFDYLQEVFSFPYTLLLSQEQVTHIENKKKNFYVTPWALPVQELFILVIKFSASEITIEEDFSNRALKYT